MKRKKIYIGGKAGDTNFISQRKQLGAPGPIAGIGGETTKCLWCGKLFDGIMASCGTGTTWSLYRCPHCKKLTADGNIIPNVVKTDPMIKIMNGSENVALGKTALSGSPEWDACHSFLGKTEDKMKFNLGVISLCKQVAEKYRKELKIGLYVWQEFSKTIQIIYGLDEEEKNINTVVSETGNLKTLYWNNIEGGWLTPLWTISDCLEFLGERNWFIIDAFDAIGSNFSIRIGTTGGNYPGRIKDDMRFKANTLVEACLKAVLAVLEERK